VVGPVDVRMKSPVGVCCAEFVGSLPLAIDDELHLGSLGLNQVLELGASAAASLEVLRRHLGVADDDSGWITDQVGRCATDENRFVSVVSGADHVPEPVLWITTSNGRLITATVDAGSADPETTSMYVGASCGE